VNVSTSPAGQDVRPVEDSALSRPAAAAEPAASRRRHRRRTAVAVTAVAGVIATPTVLVRPPGHLPQLASIGDACAVGECGSTV
jgi:hypothetical protein